MSNIKIDQKWFLILVVFFVIITGLYAVMAEKTYASAGCGMRCGQGSPCQQGLVCGPVRRCINPACPGNDPCCTINPSPPQGQFTPAPVITNTPIEYQCPMCDTNGDGVVNEVDIDDLRRKVVQSPSDTFLSGLLRFCTEQCVERTTTPGDGAISPGVSALGDCASSQGGGIKDGRTDLFDLEQLRIELSGEVQTKHCDLDGNGVVDIIDFTDFVRIGIVGR